MKQFDAGSDLQIAWMGPINGYVSELRTNGLDVRPVTMAQIERNDGDLRKTSVVVLATSDVMTARATLHALQNHDPQEKRLHALIGTRQFLDRHLIGLQTSARINMWYVDGVSPRLMAAHLKVMARENRAVDHEMYHSLLNGY